MRIAPSFFLFALLLGFIGVVSPVSFAQSDPQVSVSAVVGAASGASDSGVMLGGSVLVDLHERFSVEGQVLYLDRGRASDSLSVSGSLPINLLPSDQRVVPYAVVGGGVHRISFDLANPRFLGPVASQFAAGASVCPAPGRGFGFGTGPGFGTGTAACPGTVVGYWGVGELPDFYARRLGVLIFPLGEAWRKRSFTDPALNVGAGIRFNVTDRLMIRPDIRALVIFASRRTHILGLFGVHAGFRF